MKKILSMLVVVSIVALSAMGAFAADFTPDENGRYTVEVTGLQDGEMYGMVAIKGTDASQITEANIVYIDQATAEDGKITFTSFGTMGAAPDEDGFVEATVFIGGAGFTSAQAVGVLKAAESEAPSVEKVAISGVVADSVNPTLKTMVTVKDHAGEVVDTAETDDNGAYSIDVPVDATYSVEFTKTYYCSYTYTNVNVASDAIVLPEVNMGARTGDIVVTDEVNGTDLTALLRDFNKTVAAGTLTAGAPADINYTNEVNGSDLTALLIGFNKKGETVDYTTIAD